MRVGSNNLHIVRVDVIGRIGELEKCVFVTKAYWNFLSKDSSGPHWKEEKTEKSLFISVSKRVSLPEGIVFGKGMNGELSSMD